MSNIINTARLRQRKRRHFSSRNCRHDSYDWFIHDLAENELISRFKSYSQSFFPDIVLEKQCVVTRGFRPKLKLNHRGDFEGDVDASDIDETIIGSSISLSTFTEENDVLCDASSLPFLDGAIDVFLDSMELYLYNDVLASLQEVRRVLSDIGIYCCAFLGGETAKSLRYKFIELESNLYGSACLRLLPNLRAQSVAQLIQKIGFRDIVVETVPIEVDYKSLDSFVADVRACRENGIFTSPSVFGQKSLWEALKRDWQYIMPMNIDMIFISARA